jgi:hypothetical protein
VGGEAVLAGDAAAVPSSKARPSRPKDERIVLTSSCRPDAVLQLSGMARVSWRAMGIEDEAVPSLTLRLPNAHATAPVGLSG